MVEVRSGKVRRVRWTAVTPGAYVAAPEPDLADRLRAWSLVLPETAVVTHLTAAELRGWWLPAPVPQHVVLDDAGRFVARADLWLVGTRRLHEYDGGVHRDPATHRADLGRTRAAQRWRTNC